MTPICYLGKHKENCLYMKREDLIPFSFGGNKARKAQLFFKEIDDNNYNCVVTYGSGSSNHCRIVANECCRRGMECFIISPKESSEATFNSQMMSMFGAEITTVPVLEVHDTIEKKMKELRVSGRRPYFIEGGGHGNLGTKAYVQCYQEIKEQEKQLNIHFDYIFFASGTGTTQAGLVCGQILNADKRDVVGISIARKKPKGRDVVVDSVRSFLGKLSVESEIQQKTIFIDEYTNGYGKDDSQIFKTVEMVLKQYGIPLDTIYTGKAFMGMDKYVEKEGIKNKNILFIHTGGTPLFFDALKTRSKEQIENK